MNCFDSIPEDRQISFPCAKKGCDGSVTLLDENAKFFDAIWVCDTCDFSAKVVFE